MGQALYEREPIARAVFDQADDLLGFPLSKLCFEGPADTLTDTINQQPALFVTSLAVWQVIAQNGQWPPAGYMAGHSLGELSALTAAGAITFADGLALVRQRGQLMKWAGEQEPGAMAAILGLDFEQVANLCQQASQELSRPVQVANDNCPGQLVISGDKAALERAVALAESAGAKKVVILPITIAAHSPLMASAASQFAQAVAATPIIAPRVPVVANVTARPVLTPAEIRAELTSQLTGNVRWSDSIRYLGQQQCQTFIEVGPGDVLSGLMKRIDRTAQRLRIELSD